MAALAPLRQQPFWIQNGMRRVLIHAFVLTCLPWVTWWAWRMERRIVRGGRPLSKAESEAARRVGVRHPERIRVAGVSRVPMPGVAWMHRTAARFGFDGSQTSGMALRYGIFVKAGSEGDPQLLLHECVHTGQFERLGSLAGFLRRYLVECLHDGYPNSSLEREARDRSLKSVA